MLFVDMMMLFKLTKRASRLHLLMPDFKVV